MKNRKRNSYPKPVRLRLKQSVQAGRAGYKQFIANPALDKGLSGVSS